MDDRYRLVPVDRNECMLSRNPKMLYKKIVSEFADSDMDAVEVQLNDDIKCNTVYVGLNTAVKRSGAPVKVATRRGKIYLVKKQED